MPAAIVADRATGAPPAAGAAVVALKPKSHRRCPAPARTVAVLVPVATPMMVAANPSPRRRPSADTAVGPGGPPSAVTESADAVADPRPTAPAKAAGKTQAAATTPAATAATARREARRGRVVMNARDATPSGRFAPCRASADDATALRHPGSL